MAIELPVLDDKTYQELLDEMIASIPRYSAVWSDYNPADPGITLIELLCFITEVILYRLDRLPDRSYLNFLRLLAGAAGDETKRRIDELEKERDTGRCDHNYLELMYFLQYLEARFAPGSGAEREAQDLLEELVHGGKFSEENLTILRFLKDWEDRRLGGDFVQAVALRFLRAPYRAVTRGDFRTLVLVAVEQWKRKRERSGSDVGKGDGEAVPVGSIVRAIDDYIEVFLLTNKHDNDPAARNWSVSSAKERENVGRWTRVNLVRRDVLPEDARLFVKDYLRQRKLLGTRLKVMWPSVTLIDAEIEIACLPYENQEQVRRNVFRNVLEYLDAFRGGPRKEGWPYDAPVNISYLERVIHDTPGVGMGYVLRIGINDEIEYVRDDEGKFHIHRIDSAPGENGDAGAPGPDAPVPGTNSKARDEIAGDRNLAPVSGIVMVRGMKISSYSVIEATGGRT